MQALLLLLALLPAATNPVKAADAPQGSDIAWRLAGPGGGGWIQSIAWDPRDAQTLYVGCDVGGFFVSTDAGQHYELRNEGLQGYFVQSIAVHPRNSRILVLGTECGIFRSTDQGRHWQWIREGFPPLKRHGFSVPIGAVCFDPQRPETLYAGIGRPRWQKDGAGAIYRSDDTGQTWRRTSAGQLPEKAIVGDIEVMPGQSGTILAATSGGLYRSDDGGITWQDSGRGLTHRYVEEIAFAPSAPQVVYATLRTLARDKQPFDGGVFRSDDAGRTWRSANGPGLPNRVGKASEPAAKTPNLREVFVDPRNPDVVYVGCESWVFAGVLKSRDGGQNWSLVTRRENPIDAGAVNDRNSVRIPALSAGIQGSRGRGTIIGNTDLNKDLSHDRSSQAGRPSRTELPTGFGTGSKPPRGAKPEPGNMDYGWIRSWGPSVKCLTLSPARPDRLAFGTSGHVFVSDDGGASWQQRYSRIWEDGRFAGTGLEVTCLHSVQPDPVRRSRLWFCYADIGLLRSDDGGATFRRCFEGMASPGNCFTVSVDPQWPDTLWAGTGQWATNVGDVCLSTDAGATWQVVGKPESGLPVGQTRHLVLDPRSPADQRRLLVGSSGNGIFETRDGGASWKPIHAGLPVEATKQPRAILLLDRPAGRIVVALGGKATTGAGIYSSDDEGHTWQRLNREERFADIHALVADPRDRSILYLALRESYDHQQRRGSPGGLFVSRNGGQDWQRILDDDFVSDVAVSPADSRVLYAATTGHPYHDYYVAPGLLCSRDGGQTWTRQVQGLSNTNVSCVSVNPHDPSEIYIGTGGNSGFVGKDARVKRP